VLLLARTFFRLCTPQVRPSCYRCAHDILSSEPSIQTTGALTEGAFDIRTKRQHGGERCIGSRYSANATQQPCATHLCFSNASRIADEKYEETQTRSDTCSLEGLAVRILHGRRQARYRGRRQRAPSGLLVQGARVLGAGSAIPHSTEVQTCFLTLWS
jgi:hypothetical protein